MTLKNKELSFEEALVKLESSAKALKNDSLSLDDAIKSFENGLEFYNQCTQILEQAKQKIEVYSKQ